MKPVLRIQCGLRKKGKPCGCPLGKLASNDDGGLVWIGEQPPNNDQDFWIHGDVFAFREEIWGDVYRSLKHGDKVDLSVGDDPLIRLQNGHVPVDGTVLPAYCAKHRKLFVFDLGQFPLDRVKQARRQRRSTKGLPYILVEPLHEEDPPPMRGSGRRRSTN